MYLLTLIGGFILGIACCEIWGNHRAKYWKKQLQKVIVKADAVNAVNVQLMEVAERVRKYERCESIDEMQIGLNEAIARMSEENAY